MLKAMILSIALVLSNGVPAYEVKEVNRGLITVDINGQLEDWYKDGYNNIAKGDKVIIVGDRLIEVNK